MVRKLCIRSLRRGVGSMDFIQGLLIMEDDLDEGHEEDESDVTPTPTTSTDLACSSTAGTPDPAPSPSNNAIPWCKCGVCQIMPQEIENKCCGLRRCVTRHTRFSKLCLDPDVIQLVRVRVRVIIMSNMPSPFLICPHLGRTCPHLGRTCPRCLICPHLFGSCLPSLLVVEFEVIVDV